MVYRLWEALTCIAGVTGILRRYQNTNYHFLFSLSKEENKNLLK